MKSGSAYRDENRGAPPGTSKLQCQVLALFKRIKEPPEAVLAGNLVPFRSPNWESLPHRQDALAFGTELWRDILTEVSPQLVIAMGNEARTALKNLLRVGVTEQVPLDWGSVCGERGHFDRGDLDRGTFVGIPHLSVFAVITRRESQPGLDRLLRP